MIGRKITDQTITCKVIKPTINNNNPTAQNIYTNTNATSSNTNAQKKHPFPSNSTKQSVQQEYSNQVRHNNTSGYNNDYPYSNNYVSQGRVFGVSGGSDNVEVDFQMDSRGEYENQPTRSNSNTQCKIIRNTNNNNNKHHDNNKDLYGNNKYAHDNTYHNPNPYTTSNNSTTNNPTSTTRNVTHFFINNKEKPIKVQPKRIITKPTPVPMSDNNEKSVVETPQTEDVSLVGSNNDICKKGEVSTDMRKKGKKGELGSGSNLVSNINNRSSLIISSQKPSISISNKNITTTSSSAALNTQSRSKSKLITNNNKPITSNSTNNNPTTNNNNPTLKKHPQPNNTNIYTAHHQNRPSQDHSQQKSHPQDPSPYKRQQKDRSLKKNQEGSVEGINRTKDCSRNRGDRGREGAVKQQQGQMGSFRAWQGSVESQQQQQQQQQGQQQSVTINNYSPLSVSITTNKPHNQQQQAISTTNTNPPPPSTRPHTNPLKPKPQPKKYLSVKQQIEQKLKEKKQKQKEFEERQREQRYQRIKEHREMGMRRERGEGVADKNMEGEEQQEEEEEEMYNDGAGELQDEEEMDVSDEEERRCIPQPIQRVQGLLLGQETNMIVNQTYTHQDNQNDNINYPNINSSLNPSQPIPSSTITTSPPIQEPQHPSPLPTISLQNNTQSNPIRYNYVQSSSQQQEDGNDHNNHNTHNNHSDEHGQLQLQGESRMMGIRGNGYQNGKYSQHQQYHPNQQQTEQYQLQITQQQLNAIKQYEQELQEEMLGLSINKNKKQSYYRDQMTATPHQQQQYQDQEMYEDQLEEEEKAEKELIKPKSALTVNNQKGKGEMSNTSKTSVECDNSDGKGNDKIGSTAVKKECSIKNIQPAKKLNEQEQSQEQSQQEQSQQQNPKLQQYLKKRNLVSSSLPSTNTTPNKDSLQHPHTPLNQPTSSHSSSSSSKQKISQLLNAHLSRGGQREVIMELDEEYLQSSIVVVGGGGINNNENNGNGGNQDYRRRDQQSELDQHYDQMVSSRNSNTNNNNHNPNHNDNYHANNQTDNYTHNEKYDQDNNPNPNHYYSDSSSNSSDSQLPHPTRLKQQLLTQQTQPPPSFINTHPINSSSLDQLFELNLQSLLSKPFIELNNR